MEAETTHFPPAAKNVKVVTYKAAILPVVLYWCDTWSVTLREET
jgi:hypothetical protein